MTKSTVLIAGDSWGCGEWQVDQYGNYGVTHRGLAQLLHDDAFAVINLSQPAGSNIMSSMRIENFLRNNPWYEIHGIFVFQTDWIRDDYLLRDHDHTGFSSFGQAEIYFISQFYYSLSDIAKKYSLPICLIGGLSDTLYLDQFEREYPGLQIGCQSFVNLVINHTPRLSNPVHSCYDNRVDAVIDLLPKNDVVKKEILARLDIAKEREKAIKQHVSLFPDQFHPSATAHAELYRYLKSGHISILA